MSPSTASISAPLKIGTRRSLLARAQAQLVVDQLIALGQPCEVVPIAVAGDDTTRPVPELGTDAFVGAVRQALAAGQIDLAVHSLKDLPTETHPHFVTAAMPRRDDPRDALVATQGASLGELLPGARIGTGSPRRAAQLRALGLDFEIVPIRGNVDARLARVGADLDAVVVAAAGLRRLGRITEATEILDPLQMLPAPGQGALAVEALANRPELLPIVRPLHDLDTAACVRAERALLAALEAGCAAAVGALADVVEGESQPELWLRGIALAPDGWSVKLSDTGGLADPEHVGRNLARRMLDEGAGELLHNDVHDEVKRQTV